MELEVLNQVILSLRWGESKFLSKPKCFRVREHIKQTGNKIIDNCY